MEIRNSICKAIDDIALMHTVFKLIIVRGLGLGTIDYLSPVSFR